MIPDSTRMTKNGGDDGMPELDDISKIGKKVRTRPSHKAISQDHLTNHQDSRPSHKTISDVDCTAFRTHFSSQAELTKEQKEINKLDLGSATFQILDILAHSLYWPSRPGQVA